MHKNVFEDNFFYAKIQKSDTNLKFCGLSSKCGLSIIKSNNRRGVMKGRSFTWKRRIDEKYFSVRIKMKYQLRSL